jgi:hypothetical protein
MGKGIFGVENVARVLATIVTLFVQIGVVVEPPEVNGQPGAIFRDRDGKVINIWTLDILDGRIQAIRTVINPGKLGHLGPDGRRLDGSARGEPGPLGRGLTAGAGCAEPPRRVHRLS